MNIILFRLIKIGFLLLSASVAWAKPQQMTFEIAPGSDSIDGVYFTVPFAKSTFFDYQKLSLTFNGSKVPFNAYAHMTWPGATGKRSVRGLTFFLPVSLPGQYQLRWGEQGQSLNAQPISADRLIPIVLTQDWLAQIGYGPMKSLADQHWIEQSFEVYAEYIQQQGVPVDKKGALTAAPWLYDRVYTFYVLYLKTADLRWKTAAHEAALFYRAHINEQGFFDLKPNDMKYLYGTGLLFDYLFYPEAKTQQTLARMYPNTTSFPVSYQQRGFWTERHLAAALNMAISQWALNDGVSAYRRSVQLIDDIAKTIEQSGKQCLAHPLRHHEGKKDTVMVCSPWMSALVAEQLWRFDYLQANAKARSAIVALGQFVADASTFLGVGNHLKGAVIPDYLVFFGKSIFQDRNQWSDIQHACDVAGLLAKAQYLEPTAFADSSKLPALMQSCRRTMYHPHRKQKPWRIRPPRKFNWWFNSTANLSWLLAQVER